MIMFPFNWLIVDIIWRGRGGVRLKLDFQDQGSRRILGVSVQVGVMGGRGGREVLKIGQFSWTPYVHRPIFELV